MPLYQAPKRGKTIITTVKSCDNFIQSYENDYERDHVPQKNFGNFLICCFKKDHDLHIFFNAPCLPQKDIIFVVEKYIIPTEVVFFPNVR